MRCTVLTRGLFEVGDAYEKNEDRLTKKKTQLKDDMKVQTVKVEELTMQLSEMKKENESSESQLSEMTKQKEIAKSKCSDLEATNVHLVQEAEQARALNDTLNKYWKDS